jgi:hypothetical protein
MKPRSACDFKRSTSLDAQVWPPNALLELMRQGTGEGLAA